MHQKEPLVTIVIITYNSESYVLETLESAKNQTYPKIELIITDDDSRDSTVSICSHWIQENGRFFLRTKICTSPLNTGIPANLNRGLKQAGGEWVKIIAGDDYLDNECISSLMNYIKSNDERISVLTSDYTKFYKDPAVDGKITPNPNLWFCSPGVSSDDQYKMLLRGNRVFASTAIIKHDLIRKVNYFDESFRLLEDWPFWLKTTSQGYKIHHHALPLVFYRVHDKNLSQTREEDYLYHSTFKTDIEFRRKVLISQLPFIERIGQIYKITAIRICFFLGNDRKNILTRTLFNFFEFSNPLTVYIRLGRIFGKKYKNLKYITE